MVCSKYCTWLATTFSHSLIFLGHHRSNFCYLRIMPRGGHTDHVPWNATTGNRNGLRLVNIG